MYLWKYWRESRILFGVCVVAIAIMFLLIARSNMAISGGPAPNQFAGVLPFLARVQAFPIGFIAWLFGSFGVGRDLGERSGSYIFTRPRSRGFFVWRDWGFGLAQLLVIVALLNVAIGLLLARVLIAVGNPLPGMILLAGLPVSIAIVMSLNCLSAMLLAALVFSLTYFSTVLLKSIRGLMLGAGVLLGYLILKVLVKHYWPGVELPVLIPIEFSGPTPSSIGIADHVGLFTALRAGLILLFPIGAQLVLEKTDL